MKEALFRVEPGDEARKLDLVPSVLTMQKQCVAKCGASLRSKQRYFLLLSYIVLSS